MKSDKRVIEVMSDILRERSITPDNLTKYNLNHHVIGPGLLSVSDELKILLQCEQNGLIILQWPPYHKGFERISTKALYGHIAPKPAWELKPDDIWIDIPNIVKFHFFLLKMKIIQVIKRTPKRLYFAMIGFPSWTESHWKFSALMISLILLLFMGYRIESIGPIQFR